MPTTVAKVWRPYAKRVIAASKGDYEGLIFRDKHVTRRSKYVKEINKKFAEVAARCAAEVRSKYPEGKRLKPYQKCVGDNMEGTKISPNTGKKA